MPRNKQRPPRNATSADDDRPAGDIPTSPAIQSTIDNRSASGGTIDNPTASVWRALENVLDPEVPVLNVVEMGMIADVRVSEGGVEIDVTPTFAGCPALDVIRRDIKEAATALYYGPVTVNVVYHPPWTTDRLTEEARRKLKEFGLAPPQPHACGTDGTDAQLVPLGLPSLERIPCPYCDSTNTVVESSFGPTLCRSIHYCHNCRQSFEHFKTV